MTHILLVEDEDALSEPLAYLLRREGYTVTVAADGTPTVSAEIDVASVNSGNEQRDAHLRAADFFDVEKYPTATFVSTSVTADGEAYRLEGDFTLKGVTRRVSLALQFNGVNPGMGHGAVAGFEASVVLNRKDFGIDIDMPLETGGAVVGDNVRLGPLSLVMKGETLPAGSRWHGCPAAPASR